MSTTVNKVFLTVGFVSLFHAAFSAAQHRSFLRITDQEFTSLPIDIIIQGIVSLFMVMYGVLNVAGEFKEIRATVELESKSWDTQRNIPSFYVFNHRGKSLNPHAPDFTLQPSKSLLEESDSEEQ